MPIETSADARRSRRHAAGVDHVGHAADDRGYLAAAASRFSLWWHGDRRPPALTADTASGAGLQGGIEDDVPPSNGSAATAPSEGGDSRTDSDRVPGNRSGALCTCVIPNKRTDEEIDFEKTERCLAQLF